jgi:SAM-dependent methyltransferase
MGVAPGTWDYVHQREIADHYDDFVADTPLCHLDETLILELFGDLPSQRVIDLGCGSGRIALILLQAGHSVLGVDLSQRMLQRLREKAEPYVRSGNLWTVRANLVQLDCLAPNIVDHGVCLFSTFGMIQGRHHRRRVLSHAHRVIREGGTLLLHVHHRYAALYEPGGWRALLRSRIRSFVKRWEEFGDATYPYRGLGEMFLHRFSYREVRRDLLDSGWSIESVDSISIDGAIRTKATWTNRLRAGGFFLNAKKTNA